MLLNQDHVRFPSIKSTKENIKIMDFKMAVAMKEVVSRVSLIYFEK